MAIMCAPFAINQLKRLIYHQPATSTIIRSAILFRKHIKQHLVCWRFTGKKDDTYHMQYYPTRAIALDKIEQLRTFREGIHHEDILYRCVVFKFTRPNDQRTRAMIAERSKP